MLAHHNVNIQFLRYILQHLLLSVIIHSYVNPRMHVQLHQLSDEPQRILQHLAPLGEIKLLLEESVVNVQQIHMFGGQGPFLWRVEEIIIFKYFCVEPKIACVEDSPDVAFEQDYGCACAVVSVEESHGQLQGGGHLQDDRSLQFNRMLHKL